ncbi:cysteine desulfurase family protein [Aeoliella mucimassa]|uniref:cysteine desulfurase n=1 Tax=Aeoliella mucimassa TaxID=2527972 RepID=A0A518AP74_9BACT|nr:aminotransferase class V-fold PLP-dependent enzyme [Aeoliella mucimassa]QDU56530.1 Cysteine desulfurase [Aeoliella mucimassa]
MTLYLDDNASTRVDPRVIDLMVDVMRNQYGNAGSSHIFGSQAKQLIHTARDQIANLVAARRHEVIFTSGATESNNLALLGLAEHGLRTGKRHIVSTQIEHKAVLEPLEQLRTRGFDITLVPCDSQGVVSAESIVDSIRDDTLLLSVMQVNNETGVRQPIAAFAEAIVSRDVWFHVDAAQGFGKDLDPLTHAGIDLISISGHKIHGPQGVGALIARRHKNELPPLQPLMFGGGQELGIRPGTLPTALIAGFGLAAELAAAEADARKAHCQQVRALLFESLNSLSVTCHGSSKDQLPNTMNISIHGISSDQAIEVLDDCLALSDGSACTSVCATASHVLRAMGVPDSLADCAIRLSWSYQTNLAELRDTLPHAIGILGDLQNNDSTSS